MRHWFTRMWDRSALPEFYRELAWLLRQKYSEQKALTVLQQESDNLAIRRLASRVDLGVQHGRRLAQSLLLIVPKRADLEQRILEFPLEGEALATALDSLATICANRAQWQQVRQPLLLLPGLSLLIFVLVFAVFTLYVLPGFEDIYASFGMELPALTIVVLKLSYPVQAYWWLVLLLTIVGFGLLRWSSLFRNWWHKVVLKIPIYGGFKTECARYQVVYALLALSANKSLSVSDKVSLMLLELKERSLANDWSDRLAGYETLRAAMASETLFPYRIRRLVQTITKDSDLVDVLTPVVGERFQYLMQRAYTLNALVSTLFKILLIVLVGFFLVAMYLPIFMLGSAV